MQSQNFICMNPICLLDRRVSYNNEHDGCQDWIVCVQKLKRNEYIFKNDVNGSFYLNFDGNGLIPLFEVLSLKDWGEKMEVFFERIKMVLCEQVERMKKMKRLEFEGLYERASRVYRQVIRGVDVVMSGGQLDVGLRGSLQQLKNEQNLMLNEFQRMGVFYDRMVMPVVVNLCDFVQGRGMDYVGVEELNRLGAVKRAMLDLRDGMGLQNERLQKIAKILGKGVIRVDYDDKMQGYRSYCWICQQRCGCRMGESTRQKSLRGLFRHLMDEHKDLVMDVYMRKIGLNDFMGRMHCQRFQEVYIVDRQNCGCLEKPEELGDGCLWVEVLSRGNVNLARGQFLVAQSNRKDAADILICLLIYELVKIGMDGIVLITKDHFGDTLREMLLKMYGKDLKVMEPREFGERFG